METQLLVIEDNAELIESITELLEDADYSALPCRSAVTALNWLKQGRRADVILLDLQLPVVSGLEFLERLRTEVRPGNIPVILMTAYPYASLSPEAYPVFGFLRKPFDADDLLLLVESALAAARPRSSGAAGA